MKCPRQRSFWRTLIARLPFSDEAEKGVLSSVLQDPNERLSESRVMLPTAAFYHEANRTIYESCWSFTIKTCPSTP